MGEAIVRISKEKQPLEEYGGIGPNPETTAVGNIHEGEHEVFKKTHDGVDFRNVGWLKAGIIFTKVLFATGVLSIPSALSALGALPGAISIVAWGVFEISSHPLYMDPIRVEATVPAQKEINHQRQPCKRLNSSGEQHDQKRQCISQNHSILVPASSGPLRNSRRSSSASSAPGLINDIESNVTMDDLQFCSGDPIPVHTLQTVYDPHSTSEKPPNNAPLHFNDLLTENFLDQALNDQVIDTPNTIRYFCVIHNFMAIVLLTFCTLRTIGIDSIPIAYLVQLVKPFFQFTVAVKKTVYMTIYGVFLVYQSS